MALGNRWIYTQLRVLQGNTVVTESEQQNLALQNLEEKILTLPTSLF